MRTPKVRIKLDLGKLLAFNRVKTGSEKSSIKVPTMTMFGGKLGIKIGR